MPTQGKGPCLNNLSTMGQKSQAHTSHGWILTDEVSNPLRHPKNISHALKPHAHSREGPCMNILSTMGQKSQAHTSHGWILTDEVSNPLRHPKNISHALKPHAHSREGPCMNILSIMGQKSQAILPTDGFWPMRVPTLWDTLNISHALKPHAHSREGPMYEYFEHNGPKVTSSYFPRMDFDRWGFQPFETP